MAISVVSVMPILREGQLHKGDESMVCGTSLFPPSSIFRAHEALQLEVICTSISGVSLQQLASQCLPTIQLIYSWTDQSIILGTLPHTISRHQISSFTMGARPSKQEQWDKTRARIDSFNRRYPEINERARWAQDEMRRREDRRVRHEAWAAEERENERWQRQHAAAQEYHR
jgi:hypothetical protein